jgi:hypothetical protein
MDRAAGPTGRQPAGEKRVRPNLDAAEIHGVIHAAVGSVVAAWQTLHLVAVPPQEPAALKGCKERGTERQRCCYRPEDHS